MQTPEAASPSGTTKTAPRAKRTRKVEAGSIQAGIVDVSVRRALRRARLVVGAATVSLALVFAIAATTLLVAWFAGRALDWRLYAESALALVPVVGLVLLLCIVLAHWNWAFVRSLTLRSAALAGYDQVAPLAARQPARLSPRDLPATQTELPALRVIDDSPRPALVATVGVIGLLVLALGGWTLWRGVALVGAYAQLTSLLAGVAPTDPALRFALGALLALDGLALIVVLLLVVRHFTHLAHVRAANGPCLVVTKESLSRSNGIEPIAWTAVRAFYMAVERNWPGRATRAVYVLDTGGTRLSWAIPAGASAEVGTQHEWLTRVVVTRTKLPLRDLTTEVNRLAGPRALWSPPTALAADALVRSWIQLGVAGSAQARLRRASRRLYLVGSFAILALVLFAGAGALAQPTQMRQHAALLTRIAAATPLYADPLTAQDSDWPTSQPTAASGISAFAGNAYQLGHGSAGEFLYALAPKEYGDAAVQVTARQDGSSPSSGVGLLLRAQTQPTNFVVFAVTQRGDWFLARYQSASIGAAPGRWTLLGGDINSAVVHRGAGTTNLLTILVVGSTYTCCINGRYVGTVREGTRGGTPTTGAVGVWVGDGSTTAAFTQFAVYPAPAA